MSFNLWKFFLDDDLDGFRQYLARATYAHGSSRVSTASVANHSFKIGSPGALATSPKTPTKSRKSAGGALPQSSGRGVGAIITRADINARDTQGRTILHLAASSRNETAAEFVKALLEAPTIDLYIQDAENGWTALHRALYAGNVDVAQALLIRDMLDATNFSSQLRVQVGGLVKIKDHEGHSPFEVFGLTIAPRILLDASHIEGSELIDEEDANSVDVRDDAPDGDRSIRHVRPHTDLHGDEAYAFGSNKNLSLGLGDEDDRQYPERIQLVRPEHLLWRLHEDNKIQTRSASRTDDIHDSIASLHQSDELPAIIRFKPIRIQDIVMAKLHTAVLTDDPVSNLHICGFGPGGRLGTGDETTRFTYVCIEGGGLASRRVISVALGQDHCVAICSSGEVYTWGSNRYGQLGYVLPEVSPKETPMQLVPRQLYGLVKKETIIGAAASSIHSVIYTSVGLYTFGKNEGQLGLMDADARSLKTQDIPRRVGVSVLQSQIKAVSAIDRATTVLLENRDVVVFTHYGFTRVAFPLDEPTISFSQVLPTRYNKQLNKISKITSGGNTIGALSTFGQVFTVEVPKPQEFVPSNVSTTNPSKARNALPAPNRAWSIRKSHTSAVDCAVGQDGSIILCTEAGAVWRKEKRANIKLVQSKVAGAARPKDYKFVRVPHITGAVAVRSNAFGAFTAVRQDCHVTHEQIWTESSTLLKDIFSLLPFHDYGGAKSLDEDENLAEPALRFWLPPKKGNSPSLIKDAILRNPSAEDDFIHMSKRFASLSETQHDVWITSNVTEVRIPVHSTLLKARSRVMRCCLANFHDTYFFDIPDIMSVQYGRNGALEILFYGADFLTLVNFVLYMYTETVIDVWHQTSKALHLAPRYRQVRLELMKIASHLELRCLERAVRVMVDPAKCIADDFELAYMDLDFYTDADIAIDLAEGTERPAHSVILSCRSPFFEGLFHGRAAGQWLTSRRDELDGAREPIRVDLKHVTAEIFDIVLRHVYADTGQELFDNIVSKDIDNFIDTVIEVMSVANELMLERLVQICQSTLGKFVTPRNICGLLNTVAESSIDEFKHAGLEYICLNLEGMLEQKLLSDLDQYLLEELSEVVQDNQLSFMPFARSDKAQDDLIDRHPELVGLIEISRQRRLDSIRLHSRLVEDDSRPLPKLKVGSYDKLGSSPGTTRKADLRVPEDASPRASPALAIHDAGDEYPFQMDEDATIAGSHDPSSTGSHSIQAHGIVSPKDSESRLATSSQGHLSPLRDVAEGGVKDRSQLASNFAVHSPPADSKVSGFDLPKAAWKQTLDGEAKADLRQIMEQASTSRVSNLTEAMRIAGPPKAAVQKISQKERKRQQHEAKIQLETPDQPSSPANNPQSPWTKVTPNSRPSLSSIMTESSMPATVSKPQTPHRSDTSKGQISTTPRAQDQNSQHQQKRTVSVTGDGKIPPTQSIRHTPLPTRSTSHVDARTSMADILAQQQGEKIAIREAVAKKSLQEIQVEQEFQEWWDQESRRVQEEAAGSNKHPSSRVDEASRGKSNRRRGSGQGASSSTIKDRRHKRHGQKSQSRTEDDQAKLEDTGDRARGGSRGRGRGRGGPRHERAIDRPSSSVT